VFQPFICLRSRMFEQLSCMLEPVLFFTVEPVLLYMFEPDLYCMVELFFLCMFNNFFLHFLNDLDGCEYGRAG
jgi:hypothetical protein